MSQRKQNPQSNVFFIRTRGFKSKGPESTVHKVTVNDFFKNDDIRSMKTSSTVMNRSLSIKNKSYPEKQDYINTLSINKLRNLEMRNRRYYQENNHLKNNNDSEKHRSVEKIYRELQKNSFNNTVKEEIHRFKRHNLSRKLTLSRNKTEPQKQKVPEQCMSMRVKKDNQELFYQTAKVFQANKSTSDDEDNNFKEWSVYIRKRNVEKQPKSLKLQESDIKINTSFKFSSKRRKVSASRDKLDQICGWDEDFEHNPHI